jgi:hypothetical protein
MRELLIQIRSTASRLRQLWIENRGTSRFLQRIDEMATKKTPSKSSKPAAKSSVATPGKAPAASAPARTASAAPISSTPVRNTPIPKPVAIAAPAPAKKEITRDMIATRAFAISQSGNCGSQEDNWFRAERELRGV